MRIANLILLFACFVVAAGFSAWAWWITEGWFGIARMAALIVLGYFLGYLLGIIRGRLYVGQKRKPSVH